MYIKRLSHIPETLKEKSVLLLGPRRTGKTSYIKEQLKPDLYLSLLDSDTFASLAFAPTTIRNLIKPEHQIICVDEIQKLPSLMDEIHSLIESNKRLRFVLTGSSAKNLKRSHTSLMAGRARQINFFPFLYPELKEHGFDLAKHLLYGGLPDAYLSKDPWNELKDYAGTYLTEEIQSQAFVRKIENFSRFLEFSAKTSGQLLNFETLASDAQIPARTIKDYYHLLEETMIGYTLSPMRKKGSRKEIATSKFFFFDMGVLNAFVKRKSLLPKTKEFGDLFEHFIFLEIKSYQLMTRADWTLDFWRTHTKDEVDFVIDQGEVIIEAKATSNPKADHFKGLNTFKKFYSARRSILVSLVSKRSLLNGCEIIPWDEFLDDLWSGKII